MVATQRWLLVSLRAFAFPAVMVVVAIIPGLNFLYSGHGGPAWFFLPFAFPTTLRTLWRAVQAEPEASRRSMLRFALSSVLVYALLAYPAAVAGCASIRGSYGLRIEPVGLWGLLLSPFGWLVFLW